MGSDDSIKTIQIVYEAFDRGDIAAILDMVTDEVDWAAETTSTVAPWFGQRRGKSGVAACFDEFGSTMEVEEFSPVAFAANGNEVLTVIRFKARSRANGRSIAMNVHHYFVLNNGRISYFRGTEDTAQTEAALA
jgi:ketosteroid isomerase-like protein